jgi:hypothetical protein
MISTSAGLTTSATAAAGARSAVSIASNNKRWVIYMYLYAVIESGMIHKSAGVFFLDYVKFRQFADCG